MSTSHNMFRSFNSNEQTFFSPKRKPSPAKSRLDVTCDEKDAETKVYPPTRINIIQDIRQNSKHNDHPINQLLNSYNELTQLIFRTRSSESMTYQNAIKATEIAQMFGL